MFHYLSGRAKDLSTGYKALQGEHGQPQSAASAIDKLCDRLANGESLEDRRTALLAIKGLSRDFKAEAGNAVLPILLTILERDAPEDPEMGKTVLETLNVLCETEEEKQHPREITPAMRNTDRFLASEKPLHALLQLFASPHFYVRYFSLQLLGTLLATRPEPVQKQVLSAPGGLGTLIDVLDDKRDIIRNEGLLLLISLTATNADIQKLAAFVGAFDKLFAIIDLEGGIASGGIVVQDALAGILGLLRYNASNQNYFRETNCIPIIAPLLNFPPLQLLEDPSAGLEADNALSAFAQQYWPEQKAANTEIVLNLVRMLVATAGEGHAANQQTLLASGVSRCLAELSLASNAPPQLKAAALITLSDIFRGSPANQDMFTNLWVQPLIPVFPETYDGEEPNPDEEPDWQRAQPVPAILALIALAVQGDPALGMDAASPNGLRVRTAAVSLFENYVANNPDVQVSIVSEMKPPGSASDMAPHSAGAVLLAGLRAVPSSLTTQLFDSYAPFLSSMMFAQLLRNTEACKRLAREIVFSSAESTSEEVPSDEEEKSSLLQVLVGNLMLAQREQGHCANNVQASPIMDTLAVEWTRVMVGYLSVISIWCWESPKTVKDYLSEGANLQILIQPISQASGVDTIVQGLCALLLGILYEYNREVSAIDRQTMHPILHSRVGPDQFVNKISRLREDHRFKDVGPNVLEMNDADMDGQDWLEEGVWFDWPFVEFIRNNYLSIQRAILLDPGSSASASEIDAAESAEIIASLRTSLAAKTKDLDVLQQRLVDLDVQRQSEAKSLTEEHNQVVTELSSTRDAMSDRLAESEEQLQTLNAELAKVKAESESLRKSLAAQEEDAGRTAASASQQGPSQAEFDQIKKELEEARVVNQNKPAGPSQADYDKLKEQLDTQQAESEKESEEILVMLDDMTARWKACRARMREAKMEVSDDEGDE